MRRTALLLVTVFCLTSLPPRPVFAAGGAGEQPAAPGPLTVNLVLKPEEARSAMLVERYLLPTTLAALTWNDFSLEPSGNIELAAGGGYRILSQKPLSEESLGPIGVYAYTVGVTWTAPAAQAAKKSIALAFEYTGRDAVGVILQPAQRALLEGIRRSGQPKGSAKVLELTYLGAGKFRAKVGVR